MPSQDTLARLKKINLWLLYYAALSIRLVRAHLGFDCKSGPVVEGRSHDVCRTIREHRCRGEVGGAARASEGSGREDVLLDLTHADVVGVEDGDRRRDLFSLGVLDWHIGLDDWRHRGVLGVLEYVVASVFLALILARLFRRLLYVLGVVVVIVTAGTPLVRLFLIEGVVFLVQGKLLLKLLPFGSGQGLLGFDVRRVLIFVDGYAFEIGQGRPGVLLLLGS